jgi:flagellar basal-body rod modification protein FlgD
MAASIQDVLAASRTNATGKSQKVTAQEMQDRFLSLLVTQMKNQDPLNPMDNAALTTQLAQISTVTGVDGLNETMKSVSDQIASLQSMQAVTLAGRTVVAPGNAINLPAQGKASYGFEFESAVESAVVTITDASGKAVRTVTMPTTSAGLKTFEWDGMSDAGARVPAGTYQFVVQGMAGGKSVTPTTFVHAKVEGIVRDASGVQLNLGALGTKAVSDVRQVM